VTPPAVTDAAEPRATRLLGSDPTDRSLRRHLAQLPGVDGVGLTERAAQLATRSLKGDSKRRALDLAVSLIDLTTLEGADTAGRIRSLVAKARQPDLEDPGCPRPAAVCVYGDLVAEAVAARGQVGDLAAGGFNIAAVATAFPSGRASREVKLADTREAIAAGAEEIDMVIDRGAFLAGRYGQVFDDIVAVKDACLRPDGSRAHLKVILETGELGGYDAIRRASWLAILAGADFIKTSTGKISSAATRPTTLLMLRTVGDWHRLTGERIGVKPAGGIRAATDALAYLVLVAETLGEEWLRPELFRFGASGLLNDILLQRQRLRRGAYSGPDHVTTV